MGYAHFDAIKKQQLRDRIVDAINQLKIWNEAVGINEEQDRIQRLRDKEYKDRGVIPPAMGWAGRTVSAHDAMGGGDIVGGGASALSSGWSSGVGDWPGKLARENTVGSPPPYHNKGWNVMDWANGKYSPSGSGRSGSDKEKMNKARSKSAGRTQTPPKSRAPSKTKSRHQEEIFIPDLDLDEEEDGWIHVEGSGDPSRGRSPQPVVGRSGQAYAYPQWVHLNPNRGPNVNRPSSRQHSPSPYNGIYGPAESRVSTATNHCAFENFGSVLGASINAYNYGHHGRQGHHRISSHDLASTRHGIRMDSDATAAHRHLQATKARKNKRKEKKRAKEIGRARSSKLAIKMFADANGYLDTESEEESENYTTDEDVDKYERARRYEGGNTTTHQERLRSWHDYNGIARHAGQGIRSAAASGGAAVHPASRNESPNQRSKKRPPPLNLTPPPGPPANLASTSQYEDTQAANHVRPAANGQTYGARVLDRLSPSELAQLQFEQQRKDYQWKLAQQNHQPSMMQVAQHVANRVAAEQEALVQAQTQQMHGHALRVHASWDQLRPAVDQQQPWHPYHPHQQQRQSQRLRATMTEIYD